MRKNVRILNITPGIGRQVDEATKMEFDTSKKLFKTVIVRARILECVPWSKTMSIWVWFGWDSIGNEAEKIFFKFLNSTP